MTSTYLKAIMLVILLAMFNACEEDRISSSCGPLAVISDDFDTATSDPFSISAVSLDGQCLAIEIAAGGCDGKSWEADLLISKLALLSLPPQVGVKLILKDEELCEAAIKRTFYFDMEPLKEIDEKVIFRIEGWDEPITYPGINSADIIGKWNLISINGGLTGIDEKFNEGEISWTFNEDKVVVDNTNTDGNREASFESGTYSYELNKDVSQTSWSLQINEINLGIITFLDEEKLIVDQRASDGFQYILVK